MQKAHSFQRTCCRHNLGIRRLRGCETTQHLCQLLDTALVCRKRPTIRRVQEVQGAVLRGWFPAGSLVQDLLCFLYGKGKLLQGIQRSERVDIIVAVANSTDILSTRACLFALSR